MDFNLSLDDISKQFKDVTKLFTSSGPGLPVADLDMVIEADRMYAEGSSRWHPPVSYTHLTLPTILLV